MRTRLAWHQIRRTAGTRFSTPALMDELRALYRTLLPGHRDRLEALRERVGHAADSVEAEQAWQEIMREAHTLKGSGGQFGFPEITDAALALRQADALERSALLDALCGVVARALADGAASPEAEAPAPPGLGDVCARSATASCGTTPSAARGRVLVVEDDPLIASVICNTLRRHDYAPTHCDLGARALTVLYDEPPTDAFDFVLLDISMPGVSGLDVLARIRQEPTTADLPVMMVSAHIDASTITYARSLGADDYLTKPFSPDTLLRHIAALTEARSASRTSAAGASTL